MFHAGLQLQFIYLPVSIIFVEMCLKNNWRREIIRRKYANYKFRSLWLANLWLSKILTRSLQKYGSLLLLKILAFALRSSTNAMWRIALSYSLPIFTVLLVSQSNPRIDLNVMIQSASANTARNVTAGHVGGACVVKWWKVYWRIAINYY